MASETIVLTRAERNLLKDMLAVAKKIGAADTNEDERADTDLAKFVGLFLSASDSPEGRTTALNVLTYYVRTRSRQDLEAVFARAIARLALVHVENAAIIRRDHG